MSVLAVIPARFQSSRFPGKPLVDILGKSMIQRVYEQTSKVTQVDQVIVATDDQRIYDHLKQLDIEVEMTSAAHPSGTDRCAEVARRHSAYQVILNVQGDEPFIQPEQIDLVLQPLLQQKASISTLAKKIDSTASLTNPNVVKVVLNQKEEAIYFSRFPIPFQRDQVQADWLLYHTYFKHLGLYGFRRETLLDITTLERSPLETAESLEQLRWLENGYSIAVAETKLESHGIDTPEDLKRVVKLFGSQF